MDFFKKLEAHGFKYNDSQKQAITHVKGPLLVIAGPGSGKTSVITSRTAYLIQKAQISPSNILVITFTRAAANEMRARFKSFPGITEAQVKEVEFGTFHSTFYKIINKFYGRQIPVLEHEKAFKLVKSILHSLREPYDDETIEDLMNEISLVRTNCETSESFKSEHYSKSRFASILNMYEEGKHGLKCIDFDDMLIMCKNILESDTSLLNRYRNKYKYILVDEFQDANSIQIKIIEMLAKPLRNICVVGDDDQSIYGFRGAVPECLLDFEKEFSPCKTAALNINYRSTSEILDMAEKVVSNNSIRKYKNLISYRGSGKPPVFINPPDEEAEASFIADTIQDLSSSGYSLNDFAVLYRSNIQSRPIIDEFVQRNIPFNIKDGLNNFFNHWICRDITCYLKLSINPEDIASLIQIINRPVRYITRESVESTVQLFKLRGYSAVKSLENSGLKDFQLKNVYDLFQNLNRLRLVPPPAAVNFIRKSISYDSYIRSYCENSNLSIDDFFEILDEYETSMSGFKTIPEFLSHIEDISDRLNKKNCSSFYKKDSVTLTTIHSAKGLEFPCIFISGAIEDFMPHKKSIETGEGIEEERRLFYVAVTRAKDMIFVSSPRKHHGKSAKCSRFVTEASSSNTPTSHSFKIGQFISHSIFGTGRILRIEKGTAEVLFNGSSGKKQLDIDTCVENHLIDNQS